MVYKPTNICLGVGHNLVGMVWFVAGIFLGDPCTEAVPDGHLLQKDTLGPLLCNIYHETRRSCNHLEPTLPRSQRGLQFDPTCQHLWRLRILLTFVDTCWEDDLSIAFYNDLAAISLKTRAGYKEPSRRWFYFQLGELTVVVSQGLPRLWTTAYNLGPHCQLIYFTSWQTRAYGIDISWYIMIYIYIYHGSIIQDNDLTATSLRHWFRLEDVGVPVG